MDFLPTNATATGSRSSCWCRRNVSRSNRRARERTFALPSFREVTTPTRESDPVGRTIQFKIKQPLVTRRPASRNRANSTLRSSRLDRPNRSRTGAGSVIRPQGLKPELSASVPPAGGSGEWPARFWWNYDSKTRAGVSGGSSTVGIGVSCVTQSIRIPMDLGLRASRAEVSLPFSTGGGRIPVDGGVSSSPGPVRAYSCRSCF